MDHRQLPSWWKVAVTGTLAALAWTTTDMLANHHLDSLVLLNGAANGLLAGAALTPCISKKTVN
ncbi:hypothetical protein KGA66_27460 [Actinocrinis puniceicyclus]|uniref:Uncharacterized protein n=1 Tax=Actinocrinis puniceicyclus TaxID=977794 RepID=A0A8J8BFM4_9ACTN|nr:hypothetical protein [Actinocrinis puniceicyclus]MBS2966805.1 hypothetical protein [Actinocrinis puniceicyclus]